LYGAASDGAVMTRGVVYIVWGDLAKARVKTSVASLRRFHPDWPVHVQELGPEFEKQEGMEVYRGLLEKAKMNDYSPFEETLYLDADTTVMAPLDYGFEQAERFGLACTHCVCPWARRYNNIPQRGDTVEYSTGVMFWVREKAQRLFDEWKRATPLLDSSILFFQNGEVKRAPYGDQGAFSAVVESTGFNPFVLPTNWNYVPQRQDWFFGPIKVWHDYREPPQAFWELNGRYLKGETLIDYHKVNWGK
jgi:hypothetical protein